MSEVADHRDIGYSSVSANVRFGHSENGQWHPPPPPSPSKNLQHPCIRNCLGSCRCKHQRHLVLASGFISRAEPTSKIFSYQRPRILPHWGVPTLGKV